MQRKGFTVAPLLALVLVALALAMTLAGVATYHLNAGQRADANEKALYLAEGVVSQTMADLHVGLQAAETGGQQFGLNKESVTFAPYPERPDAHGLVSFDPGTPWGASTNNFDGTHSVGWNNIPVPPNTAHVIAQGTFGTATRTIEAFISVPPYAFAVATQGNLISSGPILARAEASMATLAQNVQNGTPDTTLPANVGSNGSISSGSGTDITGDVVAPSPVTLANPSTVGGAVRTDHIAIPVLSVTAYDNSTLNVPTMDASPPVVGGACQVATPTYAPQSVQIAGDLQVTDSILYVDGDLTVQGGIRGTGSVCVHGNVTVNGGADLSASNQVALLSTGNVTLQGNPGLSKYFQGLVYCEGSFSTSDITVAGAMLVAPNANEATANGGSTLTLGPNTHLVFVPSTLGQTVADLLSPGERAGPLVTPGPGSNVIQQLFNTSLGNYGTCPSPMPTFMPGNVRADTLPDTQVVKSVLPAIAAADPSVAPYLLPSRYHPFPPSSALAAPPQQVADPTFINLAGIAVQLPPGSPYGQGLLIGYQTIEYNPATNRVVALQDLVPPVQPIVFFQTHEGDTTVDQATADAALSPLSAGGNPLTSQRLLKVMAAAQMAYMKEANSLLSKPTTVPQYFINNFLNDTTPLAILSWQVR